MVRRERRSTSRPTRNQLLKFFIQGRCDNVASEERPAQALSPTPRAKRRDRSTKAVRQAKAREKRKKIIRIFLRRSGVATAVAGRADPRRRPMPAARRVLAKPANASPARRPRRPRAPLHRPAEVVRPRCSPYPVDDIRMALVQPSREGTRWRILPVYLFLQSFLAIRPLVQQRRPGARAHRSGCFLRDTTMTYQIQRTTCPPVRGRRRRRRVSPWEH